MSNLFSYELDEEQIRSTLLSGGKQVDLSDPAWDEFEANFLQNVTNTSPVKFKLPEFNLNINRNIVLPVIFIAGLVGVSAIMLSFIDFKTNTPPQVEKSLVPDPNNYKPEESKAAVLVKKEPQKPVAKPPVTETVSTVPVNTVVVQPPVVSNNPPANSNAGQANLNTNNPAVSRVAEAPAQTVVVNNAISDTAMSSQNTSRSINTNSSQQNNYQGQSRKKRRKLPPEQIETIKAPSILGTETTKKEEEPELEIKLD